MVAVHDIEKDIYLAAMETIVLTNFQTLQLREYVSLQDHCDVGQDQWSKGAYTAARCEECMLPVSDQMGDHAGTLCQARNSNFV